MIIVSAYMLLAIVWWTVLLLQQNDMILDLSTELRQKAGILVGFDEAKSERQYRMIYSESIVFGLALLTGMYLLYRSYKKELLIQTNKSNFLLSITHELKTPITAIKLFLQTVNKRMKGDPSLSNINDQALAETDRLENIINKLLTANKLETAFDYVKEALDPNHIISQRIDQFLWRKKDMQISYESTDDAIIFFDQSAFTSIVDNLIENAYKYSSDRKQLNIKRWSEQSYTFISFNDLGVGIPDSEKRQVFQKFYRIGDEETRNSKGTGLGLYIVKQFVDHHKANIKIKDNHPSGSQFILQIKKHET